MRSVLVSGPIANRHLNGGGAWVPLSYALGFRQLGFSVHFVEQISRDHCVGASGAPVDFEHCRNRAFFRQVRERFNLSGHATLVYEDGEQTDGLGYAELLDLVDAVDVLINLNGHLTIEPLKRRPRCKVYIDLDPGFTQFWHAAGLLGARLAGHDEYFTVGQNVGTPYCSIPTGNISWRHTRPPVVLAYWPATGEVSPQRFTTVASWRGAYGPVEHDGKRFGVKVHEFRKFVDMPTRTGLDFEIALDIHAADERDADVLRRHGWRLVDPRVVVPDPMAFRHYVQTSTAEFSAAQGIYVETDSGWISDRTVRYLASGKPAVIQDTGLGRNLPLGEGLIPFRTLEEAAAGVEQIVRDYDRHRRAARTLAEELFDSDRVLGQLLAGMGVSP